ncbi:MAG TPA: Dot/Icm secretion system protein IcmQ [Gammaproteobacteria bacterium]|nr:Dot/Icm secretion system protein IcmQ [Gammaproteobacteria bacterium]
MYQQEARDRLVNALDKAINEGQWEGSLFFRNILKRLHEIREYVVVELDDPEQDTEVNAELVNAINKQEQGYQKVYIAIYQAQGDRLAGWTNAVSKLCDYYISRPVYQKEDHVREMIFAKRSRNDAYVAIWVRQEDILGTNKTQDRWGHELLILKEGSVKVENIIEFVHDNYRYSLMGNKLVLNNA